MVAGGAGHSGGAVHQLQFCAPVDQGVAGWRYRGDLQAHLPGLACRLQPLGCRKQGNSIVLCRRTVGATISQARAGAPSDPAVKEYRRDEREQTTDHHPQPERRLVPRRRIVVLRIRQAFALVLLHASFVACPAAKSKAIPGTTILPMCSGHGFFAQHTSGGSV
jgi:hypothetical protein